MFEVGQKYRILKSVDNEKKLIDETKGSVGTVVEILGVDDFGDAWFNENRYGNKDYLFACDLENGTIELVEEEDILKQKLDEYYLKNTSGAEDVMYSNYNYIVGLENGFIDILRRGQDSNCYIKFPESDLEQVIVALTALLGDK